MSFKIDDHFSLLKVEKIKESKEKAYFYEHKKTKATVLFFENQNENAGFGIFFRTPLENSKGTAHILEHSVFEGSRKYDQENSLDFILNNSLASAFNAVTYPDKTGYYFCSSFSKDYFNLLDIYLDFIFFPKLQEKTLKKEGHFFKKIGDKYEFNGIVFNEMKNSLLSLSSRQYRQTLFHVFPDSNYSHNSGGDPIEIVDLNHEELKDFHKKYYHPSNSYTVLYGKINKNKVFQQLNETFSEFDFSNIKVEYKTNLINQVKNVEIDYQDNQLTVDLVIAKEYAIKNLITEEDFVNFGLVRNALLAYDFSPLRRIIEDSGLCASLEYYLMEELKVPLFSIVMRGVKKENIEKLNQLVDQGIKNVSKNIPKDIKELAIKRYEYTLKENENYKNQGEDYIFSAVTFLNYGLDPLIGLRKNKNLKIIKKAVKGKNLEKLINHFLGDSLVLNSTMVPRTDLIKEYKEKLNFKLTEKLAKLDLKNLDEEIKIHDEFLSRQKESPKYKSLKKLTLKDLKVEVKKFDSMLVDNIFTTNLNSSDIVRSTFYFDISKSNFYKSEIFGVYMNLLNQISSKNYKFDELAKRRKKYLERLSFAPSSFPILNTSKRLITFSMYAKFLLSDKDEVINEIKESTTNLNFKDKERILFLLKEAKHHLRESLLESPMDNSIAIVKSYLSELDYIKNVSSGISLLNYIDDLLLNFDSKFEQISSELQKINDEIFSSKCIVNLGTSEEFMKDGVSFVKNLSKEMKFDIVSKEVFNTIDSENWTAPVQDKNLFYKSVSDTNFNIMGVKYEKFTEQEVKLLGFVETYINQYLWDEIRIKNGAYGSRFYVSRPENYGIFFSYSDPKINETYKVYNNTKKLFNLSKFKKTSFEKMKLKYISGFKTIYRNKDLYNDSFGNFMREVPDSFRESINKSSKALTYNDFKELVKAITRVKNTFKVIATTEDRIKNFNEKYEEIKF